MVRSCPLGRQAFLSVPGGVRWCAIAAVTLMLAPCAAEAETITSALIRAYSGNPTFNAQRAAVRVQDETLPAALSGYRPTVAGTASAGVNFLDSQNSGGLIGANAGALGGGGAAGAATAGGTTTQGFNRTDYTAFPRSASISVTQNLFNGFRTQNQVRQADSNIIAARETMRNTELNTLATAAANYMNVLRDTAILDLDRSNVDVLREQLRQVNDRFKVGEVTKTDVSQAESTLAQGESTLATASANLSSSIAGYRQVIGVEPRNLQPARPVEKDIPASLSLAIAISQVEHPSIQAALHGVDAAELQVKIVESALFPQLNVVGSAAKQYDAQGIPNSRLFNASLTAQLNVPLYDGGLTFAQTRQAKENVGQQRLLADVQRDNVRAAVVTSWGVWKTSIEVIKAQQAAVRAAEIALNGVREEAKVGQRTTLDVLNAQQTLLNSRVQLISAQRDRVVGSYSVLASIGRLSAQLLGLKVVEFDPTVHYDQVKDKWFGLRTPDGR